MHGPSSRKRCFVLEGKSEVLSVQAAAFRRNVQGHRELNTAKCVESCCRGLEERLARKGWLSNARGRGGKVEARPRADRGMKMRSFAASTLSWLQSRIGARALVTFALEWEAVTVLVNFGSRTFSWCR